MAFTKYASLEQAEVLEVKGSAERIKSASLDKLADFEDYRTKDGYLYARIRAISSRVNKNHDGWPSIELAGGEDAWEKISANRTSSEGFTVEADADQEYGFPTFLGKPIFVDHHNSNPKKARGVIVDSKFKVLDQKTASGDNYWGSGKAAENHMPPVETELLLEIDAKTFPRLAKAVLDGDIDGFSMGCDVEMSKCSVCDNEARSPSDYCLHVKQKGAEFDHYSADGTKTSKKAYEDCYGIKFFEISAVFDPADETALAREIIAKIRHEADFEKGDEAYRTEGPSQHVPLQVFYVDKGTNHYLVGSTTPEEAIWYSVDELSKYPDVESAVRALDPDNLTPEMFQNPDPIADDSPGTLTIPKQWPQGVVPKGARTARTADAPPPQSEMTKAPQAVDTLRENKICPVCGSDIEGTKCEICQYVPPPDGLDNPDLSKAREQDHPEGFDLGEDSSPNVPGDPLAEKPPPGAVDGTSYLRARNSARTARVTSEMDWAPEITPRLAAVLEADAKPSEEPAEEVVTKDEDAPTTSSATPADPSAKPDKQVSVTDVGGVVDATNEEASKPDVKTQVDGTGGITDASNEQATKPDEKQDVSATDSENAGFNKDKTTDDSGPTKTFPKGKKDIDAGSPHDNKAFTGAAQGTAKPPKTPGLDVDADARVDVENSDGFNNPGTDTDQWTGTGGNGVTRQQDPVTKQVGPGNDVKSSKVFRALKLADTEVKVGLTSEDDKYNRIAELAEYSDDEFKAAAVVVARVKTAGLAKRTTRTAQRMPNLQSKPEPQVKEAATDEVPDEAVFFTSQI